MVQEQAVNVDEWGKDLERRRAWVLHRDNLAAGPVSRYYSGKENDRYLGEDGREVTAPVLLLETGHALLANPISFIEMGPEEAKVYIDSIDNLRESIIKSMQAAARVMKNPRDTMPELPAALVVSAVRSQLHALEATVPTTPPPPNQSEGEGVEIVMPEKLT